MEAQHLAVFCLFLFGLGEGKVFKQCELAQVLKDYGMDAFGSPVVFGTSMPTIEDWVCLAWGESRFDSSAENHGNDDGSVDLGIFQISDAYWCEYGKRGGGCLQKCENFLDDDLTDDMKCAKKIFYNHRYDAWVAWRRDCKGSALESLNSCFTKQATKSSTNIHDLLKKVKPGVRRNPE